jgi:predicted nucleic acid-binding protein
MPDKIFIDSNVFLYALSTQDTCKQKAASALILEDDVVISAQVINEVCNNLLKKLKFSEVEIIQFIGSCFKRYSVVELTQPLLSAASELRGKHNFSFYDSLIVAAAQSSQASVLYSEDMQHGLIVDEKLVIINPFKL